MGTVPLIIIAALGHTSVRSILKGLMGAFSNPLGASILALMCWCGVSLLWADEPNVTSLLRLTCVIALSFLLPIHVGRLNDENKNVLSNVLILSFVFVLIVLLIEGLTGAWLHRQIRPDEALPREGEWVPYLEMVAARGTAFLAPFCFLIATLIGLKFKHRVLGTSFILLSLIAAYMLPMAASALAILVGAAVYSFTRWQPKWAVHLMFSATIAIMLSSPFLIANVVDREGLNAMGLEISRSAEQRLAIWEFTASEIQKRPVLGHGFDSSRVIGARDNAVEGTNWQALPLHPHNAFLQIWLELGLVGIALTGIALWALWCKIAAESEDSQHCAVYNATFCAVLVIALISFGVWQYWWIAMWGLLCGALTLLPRSSKTA